MRKTVIALIIVLPIVFVLIVFTSLNSVSVKVPVSVSGIRAFADGDPLPEGEAFFIDMADQKDHRITAQVEPANAYEKGYTLLSDNPEVLTVSEDGYISALSEGTANVIASSKDRGYTARVPVAVTSSKPYAVSFSLFDGDGKQIPLSFNSAASVFRPTSRLEVGSYGYSVAISGGDSDEYSFFTESVQGVDDISAMGDIVNKGENKILLPFSGETVLALQVKDAVVNGMLNRTISRKVVLDVAKVQSESGIVVNGVPDGNTVLLSKGSTRATVYVECEGEPLLEGEGISSVSCAIHGVDGKTGGDRHKLDVSIESGVSEIDATLTANGKSVPVKFSFADFDFKLRSSLITQVAGEYSSVILKDSPTTFYAVPAAELGGVNFVWSTSDDGLTLTPSEDGASCAFNASRNGEFSVEVEARLGDDVLCPAKRLKVFATTKTESVIIVNNARFDLAERYTVGGKKFDSRGDIVDNVDHSIEISVKKKGQGFVKNDCEDIEFESSDPSVATVGVAQDGKAYLEMKKSGAVTITARWMYNEEFGGNATQSVDLNVAKDAVEVSNYPELVKTTDDGQKVVLTADIMLGTDADGAALSISERQQIAAGHRYRSTFNTAFYAEDSKNHSADEAYVAYAMEFKADVYGNGHNINAEYFTNAVDAAGAAVIFRGPLVFVEYKSAAAVAGQDNIAFLIRTDGVKLYGVNLLGCSDDSLYDEDESGSPTYQLKKLNKLGTTLEINADCEVINCRIRNGRNVVRAYGGNRDGNNYFVSSLPNADLDPQDRINVTIAGCVITQGREFLVKIGSNKALRANSENGQEPVLKDANGNAYPEAQKTFNGKNYFTNNYDVGDFGKDSFFYRRYVTTDVTLRDSVLETSGLFCVGVESNFSGALLYSGASALSGEAGGYAKLTETWRKSGATSFASILRLEGDVRTYEWKEVSKVNSSTLIEPLGKNQLGDLMKFDVSAMLEAVDGVEEYANLLYKTESENFVHGGIAFYGGGRNYSQISIDLKGDLGEFKHISINIGQFAGTSNDIVSKQAQRLPLAAGTHDFNFWIYAADGANNFDKQRSDASNGVKYSGVSKIPLFASSPA